MLKNFLFACLAVFVTSYILPGVSINGLSTVDLFFKYCRCCYCAGARQYVCAAFDTAFNLAGKFTDTRAFYLFYKWVYGAACRQIALTF